MVTLLSRTVTTSAGLAAQAFLERFASLIRCAHLEVLRNLHPPVPVQPAQAHGLGHQVLDALVFVFRHGVLR